MRLSGTTADLRDDDGVKRHNLVLRGGYCGFGFRTETFEGTLALLRNGVN